MGRLIDADKLDEEVMYLFITITGKQKQSIVVDECKKTFRNMIDEQPTVELPETAKWIPCSERLPEESGKYEVTALDEVHVTVEFSNGERRVDTGKTIDGKWKCQARIIDPKAKIVAWMPNPEPYM